MFRPITLGDSLISSEATVDHSEGPGEGSLSMRQTAQRSHAPASGPAPAWISDSMDYRNLLERIPAVSYIAGFGESGRWEYVSPQIEEMLGFTPEEWKSDSDLWFRQIHPEDRGHALEDEVTSKATGNPLRSEYRILAKDGHVVWVRDEAALVRDQKGAPRHWQGFIYDITGRKETEHALEESESRYRGLFDHAPVGIYRTTPDGKLEDGNRALARILG